MALSKALIKKLKKKYKRPLGTKVGDSRKIMQQLTKGANVSQYMAKDGGYVAKKGKKLEQKDEMDKEKLQSQEDQADLRAEVALRGQRRQDGSK